MRDFYIITCLNRKDNTIRDNHSVLYNSYKIATECCELLNKAAKDYNTFYYKVEKI